MSRVRCFVLLSSLVWLTGCSGTNGEFAGHDSAVPATAPTTTGPPTTTARNTPTVSAAAVAPSVSAATSGSTTTANPGVVVNVRIPAQGISERLSAPYGRHDGASVVAACSLSGANTPGVAGDTFVFAAGSVHGEGRVKFIELATIEDAKVPGIAKGRGTIRTAIDTSITGTITLNSDRLSGSFQMTDSNGAVTTGSFNCGATL